MTPEQEQTLLSCKFRDLPKLFPEHSMDELRRIRKRLQNARSGRNYCQRNYVVGNDGPLSGDQWIDRAREGSAKLLAAIRRASA